jgi:hypothetical protein
MPVIPAHGKQRQGDLEFQINLGYISIKQEAKPKAMSA